jgi:type IV secretion system protein VirB4
VRRRNGMIVYITPTPEVLTKDDDLRQQFKTSIFFPNPKGSHKTYCEEGGLGCTEKEYEFLTTEDPKNRKFLIKTDHDSVISSLDLGDMMEFVQLFSGNDEKNGYIDQLVAEIGNEEPSTWLPQFNQRYH